MKNLILTLLVSLAFCLNSKAERLKVCYISGAADSVRLDSLCDKAIDDEDVEAVAFINTDTKMVIFRFYADYPAANINIYKDDRYVISVMRLANSRNTSYFDFSKREKGLYQIRIVVHQDEDLCGSFELK